MFRDLLGRGGIEFPQTKGHELILFGMSRMVGHGSRSIRRGCREIRSREKSNTPSILTRAARIISLKTASPPAQTTYAAKK
jgi:hypothetical protein